MLTVVICAILVGHLSHILGCGQVVRHMVLVHAFGGSNPSTPAKFKHYTKDSEMSLFAILSVMVQKHITIKPVRIIFVLVTVGLCLYGAFYLFIIGNLEAWAASYNPYNEDPSGWYYVGALACLLPIYPIIKIARKINI